MAQTRGPQKIVGLDIFSDSYGVRAIDLETLSDRYSQDRVVGEFQYSPIHDDSFVDKKSLQSMTEILSISLLCSMQELNNTAYSV